MSNLKYVKPELITLANHAELNERWVQERIAEDPSLLGLGDIVLKDKERVQPHAGRLDLLCQDAESNRRYEIEIQLGKTDESHLIRTIEYWDIGRKRYPQYDHTAVIVAETITSRFLNVIGLFNGFIPLVAIQMQGLTIGDQVSLVFTTVLNEMRLGLVDEEEEVKEVTNRSYWEERASKATLEMMDSIMTSIQAIDPGVSVQYNKFYIGMGKNGQTKNFVVFRPKKDWLRFEPRLQQSDDIQMRLDEAGLDLMEYASGSGRYRLRLGKGDVQKHEKLIKELLQKAYTESGQ
ncbi:MAG: hypothetical protein HYR84_10200 [Planctomycetes bacterium]|nr:hypothetical protein [Planctomycetota bacterium]